MVSINNCNMSVFSSNGKKPTVAVPQTQNTEKFLFDELISKQNDTDFVPNNKEKINKPVVSEDVKKELHKIFSKAKNLNLDGKVGISKQGGIGDCWLLAAINARLDKSIDNIVHKNEDYSCSITFKECNIDVEDKDGDHTILFRKTDGPINVSFAELHSQYYGEYYDSDGNRKFELSEGDDDVRAIEIAYLKKLERSGLDMNSVREGNFGGAGLNLLYPGSRIFGALSQAGIERESWGYNSPTYAIELMDLSELMKDSDAITASRIKSMDLSLDNAKSRLISAGYNEELVHNSGAEQSRVYDSAVVVPTKSGKSEYIHSNHAYTVKNVKDGYVELINPWNSQESFEISEIDFKLIFNRINYVEKNI